MILYKSLHKTMSNTRSIDTSYVLCGSNIYVNVEDLGEYIRLIKRFAAYKCIYPPPPSSRTHSQAFPLYAKYRCPRSYGHFV